jgi:hypothetical protein
MLGVFIIDFEVVSEFVLDGHKVFNLVIVFVIDGCVLDEQVFRFYLANDVYCLFLGPLNGSQLRNVVFYFGIASVLDTVTVCFVFLRIHMVIVFLLYFPLFTI